MYFVLFNYCTESDQWKNPWWTEEQQLYFGNAIGKVFPLFLYMSPDVVGITIQTLVSLFYNNFREEVAVEVVSMDFSIG